MTGVRLGKVPCVPIEEEYVSAERWVILEDIDSGRNTVCLMDCSLLLFNIMEIVHGRRMYF